MAGKQGGVRQTSQQRAQAEVAIQQLQDFKQRWQPVQKQLAETIVQAGQRGSFERKQAQGMAATDTAAQFGQAQEKLREQTEAQGLGGSSKQKLAIAGMGNDQAMSTGMGIANADQRIDDAYVQGLGQIMALGRGEKTGAMQGIGQMARMSGQQAQADAALSMQRQAGQAQFAGQALGMGLSGAFGSGPAQSFTTPNAAGNFSNPVGETSNFRGAELPYGLRGGGMRTGG